MSAKIIDGKILAAEVKACAAQAVRFLQERYGITPCLAVLLGGDDPASQVYVRGKANDCEACGIESRVIRLPEGDADLLGLGGFLSLLRAALPAVPFREPPRVLALPHPVAHRVAGGPSDEPEQPLA